MSAEPRFATIIIVRNPASTSAAQAALRIAELQRQYGEKICTLIDTKPGGPTPNRTLLHKQADLLGDHALLCIAGGDGTVSMVAEQLLSDPRFSDTARRTPILPLWGGNANDLAHMLNGAAFQAKLMSVVERGAAVRLSPLECTLTYPDGSTGLRHAVCYISFGASATTAHVLATTIRRQTFFDRLPIFRFFRELLVVMPAMRNAPTFAIQEGNKRKTVYENIFFKGPRFAKVSGVKRQLTGKTFHRALVERKRFSDVMLSIAALGGRRAGRFEGTEAAFTVLESTWAQFDGETVAIEPGTQVHIRIGERPLTALSLRIAKTDS